MPTNNPGHTTEERDEKGSGKRYALASTCGCSAGPHNSHIHFHARTHARIHTGKAAPLKSPMKLHVRHTKWQTK